MLRAPVAASIVAIAATVVASGVVLATRTPGGGGWAGAGWTAYITEIGTSTALLGFFSAPGLVAGVAVPVYLILGGPPLPAADRAADAAPAGGAP